MTIISESKSPAQRETLSEGPFLKGTFLPSGCVLQCPDSGEGTGAPVQPCSGRGSGVGVGLGLFQGTYVVIRSLIARWTATGSLNPHLGS